MTIQQFQYILEVYRAGSVSQAAKNLFVGQPSVSLSITNLEKELGYPIFTRNNNGVTPTKRGMEVIEHAARICESCRIISVPEQTSCTHIRIAAGKYSFMQKAALRLLKELSERRDVAFSFLDLDQRQQIQMLSLFELDLGLCFVFSPRLRSMERQLQSKGLRWQVLTQFPAAIVLGSGHRLYDAPTVEFAMLEDDLLIDTAEKSMAISPFFNSIIRVSPDRVLAVGNQNMRTQMLEEGLGYSIKAVTPHESEQFRRIPLENICFSVLAIYNPIRPLRPEVQRYLDLLQEELQ